MSPGNRYIDLLIAHVNEEYAMGDDLCDPELDKQVRKRLGLEMTNDELADLFPDPPTILTNKCCNEHMIVAVDCTGESMVVCVECEKVEKYEHK